MIRASLLNTASKSLVGNALTSHGLSLPGISQMPVENCPLRREADFPRWAACFLGVGPIGTCALQFREGPKEGKSALLEEGP